MEVVAGGDLRVTVRKYGRSFVSVVHVRDHRLKLRWHELLQLLQVHLMLALHTLQGIKSTLKILLCFFEALLGG